MPVFFMDFEKYFIIDTHEDTPDVRDCNNSIKEAYDKLIKVVDLNYLFEVLFLAQQYLSHKKNFNLEEIISRIEKTKLDYNCDTKVVKAFEESLIQHLKDHRD